MLNEKKEKKKKEKERKKNALVIFAVISFLFHSFYFICSIAVMFKPDNGNDQRIILL